MTMVVSNQHRIFYRFEGEKGAYLLLHHGLFGSHEDWFQADYVSTLSGEFRLILPDARGHGRSDHPLEAEAYAPAQLADDMISIMDELGIHNLHFFGYSLGALVGLELLLRHPDRLRIVMMAGESPFVSTEMKEDWTSMADRVRHNGLAALKQRLHEERALPYLPGHPEEEGERDSALALLEGLAAIEPPQGEGRLSVNSPVALFTGGKDPARERIEQARKRIHRARFVSIPGQDHAGLFLEREALVTEMMRLLRSGKKEEGTPKEPEKGRESRKNTSGTEEASAAQDAPSDEIIAREQDPEEDAGAVSDAAGSPDAGEESREEARDAYGIDVDPDGYSPLPVEESPGNSPTSPTGESPSLDSESAESYPEEITGESTEESTEEITAESSPPERGEGTSDSMPAAEAEFSGDSVAERDDPKTGQESGSGASADSGKEGADDDDGEERG